MRGLMMDRPLLIQSLIRYAARYHAETEIVSRTIEGPLHRYTYANAEARAKQLVKALMRLGVGFGDRVATIAWNNHCHFEAYYAISGMGAVCHTINPRLFADQLAYIVNHAQDKVLLLDLTFVPLAEKMASSWPAVRHYVVMTDRAHMPATSLPSALCYEDIVAAETPGLEWPEFDENTAAALCYTSGTTGNPKGALYSHRSTLLHAYAICAPNTIGIGMHEAICPIVPMFHVNAWGIPYAAAMAGAKLVFPGPRLDGASLQELFEGEAGTCAAGVPTVWLGLLQHLEATGKRIDSVKRVTCSRPSHTVGTPAAQVTASPSKSSCRLAPSSRGPIYDPDLAAEAHRRGIGSRFEARFNRAETTNFSEPYTAPATVLTLTDGRCVGRRGIYAGMRLELGPCAALKVGGITVIVVSHRVQCADPVFFEMMGLDIGRARSVVVKSRGHFRGGFDQFFGPEQIVEVDLPGLTSPMLNRFTWTRLPRPVIPLDEGVDWHPPRGNTANA